MTCGSPNSESTHETNRRNVLQFGLRDLFAFTTLVSILTAFIVHDPTLWAAWFELIFAVVMVELLVRVCGKHKRRHPDFGSLKAKSLFCLVVAVLVSTHLDVTRGVYERPYKYAEFDKFEHRILAAYRDALRDFQVTERASVIAAVVVTCVIVRLYLRRKHYRRQHAIQ